MIAATPCGCGAEETGPGPAGSETYDVPRALGRPEVGGWAAQLYDTPRRLAEAGAGAGLGNYDMLAPGALPVFRKPCGCVMPLTGGRGGAGPGQGARQNLRWSCEREGGEGPGQLNIPRVRLTGQGRMPVVDMSKINANAGRCLSEPPREGGAVSLAGRTLSPARGRPPRPPPQPLYAQVDRSKKAGRQAEPAEPTAANYTNMEFAASLSLYENSRDVLSRLESPAPAAPPGNYLNMSPGRRPDGADYELMVGAEFRESTDSLAFNSDAFSDGKFNTIKQQPGRGRTVPEDAAVQGAGQGERWEEQADSGYWEQSCEAGEEKANRQYARCSSLDVEIKLLDQKLQRNIEF